MATEWPGKKSNSSVGQRITRIKRAFLSHGRIPQIGSVFVIQVVTDDYRPLQTFGRMISHDMDRVGAFIGRLQIQVSRGEFVTPENKTRDGGGTVGRGTAPFILQGKAAERFQIGPPLRGLVFRRSPTRDGGEDISGAERDVECLGGRHLIQVPNALDARRSRSH